MPSLFFSVVSFCRFLRGLPPETFVDLLGRCFSKVSPRLTREVELKGEGAAAEVHMNFN
jgi:hypothetical protein